MRPRNNTTDGLQHGEHIAHDVLASKTTENVAPVITLVEPANASMRPRTTTPSPSQIPSSVMLQ
jgi:hypothetical protein